MEEKEKKIYELAILVKNEDDVSGVVALIRANGGEIASGPHAKKLALAYEIKKHTEAIFAHLTFTAATEEAKKLEQSLNTKAEVIRFLVIASPAPSESIDRDRSPMGVSTAPRRPRAVRTTPSAADSKPIPRPLSNEALEKKIEEILQ